MKQFSPVEVAQRFVKSHVKEGDRCVDATLGNGHDSVFMSALIGDSGKCLGFDIQASAIESSQRRLAEHGFSDRVVLCNRGHEMLSSELQSLAWPSVQIIMFNLGYLPGSDKSVITEADSTLRALEAGIKVLSRQGAISIIAYRGHAGGLSEYEAVQQWVEGLPPESFFCVRFERGSNQPGQTPVFFWVKRR